MTFEFLIFNLNYSISIPHWPNDLNDQYLWAVDSMRRERKVGLLIKTSSSVVDSVIFYYPLLSQMQHSHLLSSTLC